VSKLPQIDPTTATGPAAELLAQVQKALGVTPNMTKVMANSPALLAGYLALSGALAGGVIPAPVRERLALSTAEANGCEYCLSAHTYIAAVLALSDAILQNAGDIDDETLAVARNAGVTDEEIGEIVGHIALNVLTNYFNVLTDVENDWPVVRPHAAV
jgi:AhpD family alkylhydroperoxidase